MQGSNNDLPPEVLSDSQDIVPVLIGLGYFEDADEEPSPVMIREAPWDQIKREFEKWQRSLAG